MFSGAVKILDLNDYIKPEDECIVLIKGKKITLDSESLKSAFNEEPPMSIIKTNKANVAKIALTDCLACSGCITSSETLLVEEQSIKSLLENYSNFKRRFVLISPQSLSAISHKFNIPEKSLLLKLNQFFISNFGFDFVLEISFFIELANEFAYQEFIENKSNKVIFSSECPGWVCYAEKVLGDQFLELISKIKTPQLFASEIIKQLMVRLDEVYLLDL